MKKRGKMGAAERRRRRKRRVRRESARRGPMTPSQSRQLDGIAGSKPAGDYEQVSRIMRRRKRHDRDKEKPLTETDERIQFGFNALQKLNEPLIKAAEKARKAREKAAA